MQFYLFLFQVQILLRVALQVQVHPILQLVLGILGPAHFMVWGPSSVGKDTGQEDANQLAAFLSLLWHGRLLQHLNQHLLSGLHHLYWGIQLETQK